MKNKPQRHKESNVFKFKSFGDRITEIDLRRTALYHIRHENEETNEKEKATEFHQTYCKWIVLNLTEEFAVFHKKIRDIVTLEQLFWKKDFVIEHLICSIEKATSLSLQPLLEFVVALAKDLGKEFYPYFVSTEKSFLTVLIRLLDIKESDQLEWTLICLAYLFKCLKPYLKKDITTVFDALIPLLDNRSGEHITNFAAECFSFVVRDIKDKEQFLLAILSKLNVKIEDGVRQSEILTRGCGQLLFEIVRGINGLFHSCAESYLRIYFEILTKLKPKQMDLMYDVLSETISSMLRQIAPVNMQTFWNVTLSTIEQFINDADKNALALNRMLLLMGMALETRDGKFLTNPNQFVTTLLKVINVENISNNCLKTISELVAALLLSKNVILSQLDASRISKQILTIPSTDIFESFVWNCVNFSQFEILILPEFLRYLDSKYFSLTALELMAKIILKKSPLCGDGVILGDRQVYPIQMRSVKCFKKIEKILIDAKENETFLENPREFLLALIVYSNIIGADKINVMTKIDTIIDICLMLLQPHDRETCAEPESSEIRIKNKRIIFTLSVLLENQIQLNDQQLDANAKGIHKFPLKKLVEKLLPFAHCENFSYIHGLRVLDLIITYESNQSKAKQNPDFNVDLFIDIHNQISDNLSSRYHEVRRITSHLFQQFECELKLGAEYKIYSIFSAIESIEPNVHTYREQLLLFQRIEPNARFISTLQKTHDAIKLDPLKYLLGLLYVNFNLLWKPTIELITTYFDELDIEEFWTLFKSKIDETTAIQRLKITNKADDDLEFMENGTCLSEQYLQIWHNNDRTIDLVNYRILLWRMIPLFGMLREIKNREIVTIFLDFIEHEYKKTTDRDSLSWQSQRKHKTKKKRHDQIQMKANTEINKENDDDDDDADDDADDDHDDDDNVEVKEEEKSNDEPNIPKGTQRTLIQMLQVFVNQNNPKQLHREPELWNLYMELLTHRNSTIQKLALDCVVAYKHKYLQPYKDHLYNLVDDNKFKEGINNFKIDKESAIVQPEHRSQLMPIVMRILFSKMLMRIGGQKTPNQLRKSLVMRFLGGCHEDEILIMLNMSFWMFESEFNSDAREMCLNVMTKTNITNVLSPNILQSSLDLIDVIQAEFSGLMSEKFLKYIVNILLVIGSIVQTILQQRQYADTKLTADMVKPFKNLHNKCLQNLQRFFEHFEAYNWSDSEIDAIFLIFISPLASKLSQQSQMAVTPLLKLFSTFGKSPRLFVLLTRYTAITIENIDTTPLKYVMNLLIEPKAKPMVCLTIMEMIQNLVTFGDDLSKNGIELKPLEISQCKSIDEQCLAKIPMADNLNFGSKIILPYLPYILQKFRMNLRSRRGLTKRDLVILSRITELIVDAETSNTLLTVLLPILVRKSNKSTGEEVLVQMINTISNLFKRIERPERHLRSIAPMFEQIIAIGPRKLLCDILKVIYERCASDKTEQKYQLKQLYEIVSALNALDRRWIEQPDYEKRLETYKLIGRLTAADEIDLNIGILVVYHSFFFIKHDKDMALRDSASHHLRTMVPVLIRKLQRNRSQDLDYLIGTVLLNLVRRTFRDKNDNVRNEGIQLLGEISRECPDAHPVLDDLHKLTCKQDREIDFFDNITHLQTQRHGKALLRFCSIAKTLEMAPNPRTLTQFILPLASMYISCEKYSAKHGLVTSAIETIGAVCHLLPWHQYETILKYYIKNMRYNVEYQKQMVRIVMQILDAFHFDLSKANVLPKELPMVNDVERLSEDETTTKEKTNMEQTDKMAEPEKEEDADEEVIIQTDNTETENFDEELDALNQAKQEDDADEEVETPLKKTRICIYDTPVVLSQSIARKIIHNIATNLVPTLNNSITALSTYESFHKLNKKKRRSEREEEEILRVPIALAIVKLLQKMPSGMLEQYISGILIKVCMFLKSPLISVRMTTRDILKTIMQTIGADHLEMLLGHMTSLLIRGFQVHVLTITVHSLLDALKTSLKNGIMDKCLQYVLNVCLRDIFGQTGEEKEISKIGKRTQEAKPHNKSFLTLSICASNLTQSSLLDLLLPFKEQLTRTQSKKIVLRVQECFQKIVAGLTVNKQINIETMLMFIYGVISESIPDLLPGIEQPKLSEKEKEKIKRQRPDCFLILEDPASMGRSNAIRKVIVTNVRANAHVIIEFGLELLQLTLKRGKLMKIEYQPFIDPIVPILSDSLASAHVRATTFALKCISIMFSKEMTSNRLDEAIPKIVEQIFSLLHKYVAANTDMSAENFNLVQSLFKTIVNILRYVPATKFILMEDQLKTLLFYVEQYLNIGEGTKQTIAFSLLKVIISRKLITQELNNVLMQVGRLAIQSDSDVARQESKGIIVNYLMEYPLGKKINGFIEFFISNLSYELQSGRESAINILHSIAKRFPPKYLNRRAALIFVSCGSRMINDESAECRQHIANCIETLLARIDSNQRDELFAIVLTLLNDEKICHREMAALLCTRFINAEKKKFADRIPKILPILIATLSLSRSDGNQIAGKFVRNPNAIDNNGNSDDENDDEDQNQEEERQRIIDHQLIQLQNTILKIFEIYSNVLIDYPQYADELAYKSQKLLGYEHVWVRLNALKALQLIMRNIDSDEIQHKLITGKTKKNRSNQLDYLYTNSEQEIKSLTLDLCAQLIPEQTDKEMADEVTTILLFVANILKNVPIGAVSYERDVDDVDDAEKDSGPNDKHKVNLPWLLRRLRYVIHAEVAKAPQNIILRSAIFNWIEGLTELITMEQLNSLSYTLLTPLVREMSEEDQNIDVKLRKIALRVGDSIRNKIGDDEYNLLRSQIQKKLMIRRAERKKLIAIEKISNPVRAAKRQQGIRDRKKTAKRRHMVAVKNRVAPLKKRKKNYLDDD